MPLPVRHLTKPPIIEAVVEIRGTWGVGDLTRQSFDGITKTLSGDYPEAEVRHKPAASADVANAGSDDPGEFHGVFLRSPALKRFVQFRVDAFAFSQQRSYTTGDALLDQALSMWSLYADVVKPTAITRIGLRYINRLALPFVHGDDFSRFLEAAPPSPAGAPQSVSEFFSRLVTHPDPDGPGADGSERFAIITQKLTRQGSSSLVTLDIDASKVGPSLADSTDALRTELELLRVLKNDIFFALLTQEALGLCDS